MSETAPAPAVTPATTTDTIPATTSTSTPDTPASTEPTTAAGVIEGWTTTVVDSIPVAVRKRAYEIGSLAIAVAGVIASSVVLPAGEAHLLTEGITVVGAGLPLLARSFTK